MAGSTLPRRALGRLLRDLRTKAGKTQLAASLAADTSPQSMGRLEDGERSKISTPQIEKLLDLYGADENDKSVVASLLQEVKGAQGDTKGWWRAYADIVDSHFDHYMSLEEACTKLTTFQMTLLPGLLQTSAYRRSMIVTADPDMSAVDVERRMELATRRQTRMRQDGRFSVDVLLSESALRHLVGGPAVMSEQLRHLVSIGELPNVSLRVVPFGVGSYAGLVVQSFTLFEFPPLRSSKVAEPPVVYVEGFQGALYLEEERVITRHREGLEDIRQVALNHEDTNRFVLEIVKEYVA